MPHDRKGNYLVPGDIVMIPARVIGTYAHDEYCNVSLETVELLYPGIRTSHISLNSKQVDKVEPLPIPHEHATNYKPVPCVPMSSQGEGGRCIE